MLRVTARGKVNWTLDIVGTREDGYHLMDMLMSSVEVSDILEIEPASFLELAVMPQTEQSEVMTSGSDDLAALPVESDERNLVIRAAKALRQATGCTKGAKMRLYKQIPVGAGMGGGSADAAAALMGLCRLWEISLSQRELVKIALSLGADVPFMLAGGLARVQGIGESITPLPFPAPCPLVLVQPCGGLATPEIFRRFDNLPKAQAIRPRTEEAQRALLTGDWAALAQAMGNVMEQVSLEKRPEMGEAILALKKAGALRGMMTGSGSVVYGVFETEECAFKAYEALKARWTRTYLAQTAKEGILIEEA